MSYVYFTAARYAKAYTHKYINNSASLQDVYNTIFVDVHVLEALQCLHGALVDLSRTILSTQSPNSSTSPQRVTVRAYARHNNTREEVRASSSPRKVMIALSLTRS
jgi:adenine-specific DNA glycosylase